MGVTLGYKSDMHLYTPENVYRLDQAAIDTDGLSGIELMARAGERVWSEISRRWPGAARIAVFAGGGNNGGDAFVVACHARTAGLEVRLYAMGDLSRQSDTARHFRQQWETGGGAIETWSGQPLEADLIVDGLLGIGLMRELSPDWRELIDSINAADARRVAIDIPSGLNARNGIAQPVAVRADLTVTFIGRKTGQYLADGPDYCGELVFSDLGASPASRAGVEVTLEAPDHCRLPPPRRRNTHKNHYGHVLVVGGAPGMCGAVALAARAALRSGAGLVTALVHADCRAGLAPFAEVMTFTWDSLPERLDLASVVLVGPGLGDGPDAEHCLQALQACRLPMVVDASALRPGFLESLAARPRVITPHPGEAARLLEIDTATVQADRVTACEQLVQKYDAIAVLKGSGTLVGAAGAPMTINTGGHPGMASAGMGDVLGGMIAALIGQGMEARDAACSAVFLHARCADEFARDKAPESLLAGDIVELLPAQFRYLRDAG